MEIQKKELVDRMDQTLHVMYDLRYLPVTFDCATYFVGANATRQVMGLGRMHVHVIAPSFRRYSERDISITDAEKRWRAHHIVLQVAHLLPNTSVTYSEALPESISFPLYPAFYQPNLGSQLFNAHLPLYSLKHISSFTKTGIDLRPFKCPDIQPAGLPPAVGAPLVTVSLRTSKFQPTRNSNLSAWADLVKRVRAKGYRVAVIPDFEDLVGKKQFAEYFRESDVVTEAAFSLSIRAKLYETAIYNFGVSNGVMAILYHSKNPYAVFKIITNDVKTTSYEFLKDRCGIAEGETPSFASQHQHWIWKNDDANTLREYFDLIGL
jgi:hypothetical protein